MNARPGHVEGFAPPPLPRTPFDAMLCRLVLCQPTSGRDGKRDGRRAAMLAALDYRANWTTIRAWRRGEARAPQWAIDLIREKLSRRAQADLEHVA